VVPLLARASATGGPPLKPAIHISPSSLEILLMSYSASQTLINPESSETTEIALRIENLNCYYGRRRAVEGICMDVNPQQVTAIIGPSGCGKSTFLKAINRISELESDARYEGTIEFFGQNVFDPQVNLNRLRRQIGMVFQKPNPFPMSIYDNVAYGVKLFYRVSKSRLDAIVESALQRAALWDEVKDNLKKSALSLSGGQQQRLCIARALAVKPKILLMDEPCSALDPIATMKIEELMHGLKEEVTIVIVTHNMQQAARVSDHTAFFSTDESRVGHLIEYALTEKIFNRPDDRQTHDYISGRFG
jgi:phosphate transport system ATP-binding protein